MGAVNAITNAYANLRTTTGLKWMWVIALVADVLLGLSFVGSLREALSGQIVASQVMVVLGVVALLIGKGYLEFSAHRLLSEVPAAPLADVEALSHLEVLARIWIGCFLVVSAAIIINVGAAALLIMSVVFGLIFGVFAWLFFQIGYLKFLDTVTSPFLGFFNVEGKALALIHVSPEGAIAFGLLLFTGLFLAPALMAILVLARKSHLVGPPPQNP